MSNNSLDDFLDWLETVNCPPLTFAQKVLLGFLFAVMVLVLITSFTGHAYLVVIAFLRFLDQLTLGETTLLVYLTVTILEVIGVNTTLLALAVGYVYSRVFDGIWMATLVASLVTWGAVCFGCMLAYILGMTIYKEWSRELQRRNRVFEALDTVLIKKGLTVNLMLRLVLPDLVINFSIATTSCTVKNFVLGFVALIPWIVVHCYYGASIEKLTSISKAGKGGDKELIELVVGIVVTTVLAIVITRYTKLALDGMIADAITERDSSNNNDGDRTGVAVGAMNSGVTTIEVESRESAPTRQEQRQGTNFYNA
jgi:uncharacterized membrane protein YdjX (TVP38/TMEM64 family)